MKLLLLLALLAAFFYWRRDRGRPHTLYFQKLQKLLKDYGVSHPRMVIDLDRMDANIAEVKKAIGDTSQLRIPAKSLPSFELLDYLQKELGTNRLMVFHQPFLDQLLDRFPDADYLVGKPFPVGAVRKVFAESSEEKAQRASVQVQWLVDSYPRLEQYLELAIEQQKTLKLAVEIDIGLHRGGVAGVDSFKKILRLISENKDHLSFSGLMGYEPHVSKLSGLLASKRMAARSQVLSNYQQFVDTVKNDFPDLYADDLCFNSGGSTTYALYPESDRGSVNDLAIGSAFVKPTGFDLETLTAHQPAAFIAAPVLKTLDSLQLPMMEKLSGLWKLISPNMGKVFFSYGGWWKAKPVSPQGLNNNALYGRSTNQELLTGSESTELKTDDLIFLRPTQSEFVFLQFGRLLIVRKEQVIDEWPVFNQDY
ncbi:alanine racemase [Parendozoicomonas sp. Alg238-R29]|uniref:alanine racemase n=1 Tax=Parendozoicomonas sp. Alg238-R29 TaxID=2993446 RepID=UPI00248D4290|nr:alanine racemase [Parendozoicomonas sp. Alg238-R29]